MTGFKVKISHFLAAIVLLAVGFGIGFCTYAVLDHGEAASEESSYQDNSVAASGGVTEGASESDTYYWVSDGEVYHVTKYCPTLARSKNISRGTVPPSSRRICKVCS